LCPGPRVRLRSGALLAGRVGDEAPDGGVVHLGVHPRAVGRFATKAPTGNADLRELTVCLGEYRPAGVWLCVLARLDVGDGALCHTGLLGEFGLRRNSGDRH
jgi:hypothetical protein